jgi:hypothetical protein
MADISSFKSQLAGGGARANQFRCVINFPNTVNSGGAGSTAEFLCKAASIPASTVANIEVMYRGRAVNFAGERSFDPWTVTVYNDNDFILRNAFENWVDTISNPNATGGLLLPSAYQTDLEVHQLDRNDQVLQSYSFKDAYPTSVSEIGLSWDQNNQIQEYSVTFQYNFHVKI